MDVILANTIHGLSSYIYKLKPDMMVVHGDRVEALAGAIVGALNNVLVAHIEGGERSGTIDESMRHSISKLAHLHFVANQDAKKRLLQMGENKKNVFIIGSPDIDIMLGKTLPPLVKVKRRYGIRFKEFGLFVYHPVTTELGQLRMNVRRVLKALILSGRNYVVVYPNNDDGSDIILDEMKALKRNPRFRIFASLRFEYYLRLFKESQFVIGNSSVGIRVGSVYGKPIVNIGSRQKDRNNDNNIIDVNENTQDILQVVEQALSMKPRRTFKFGKGNSAQEFMRILASGKLWKISPQKCFVDQAYAGGRI